MTAPRIIVPGATTAITRRTNLRKAFLAPWSPRVGQAWLYSLAHAQERTGVAVHHAIRVITHHHLTVTPEAENLPEFCGLLHHDISSALNTLLERERYDAPREIFDGRSTHYMRLLDDAAQATQLVYEYNNCVAAGLVSRPEHMPGYTFDFDLWKRGYLEVERPDFYFGRDRPERLRLYLTPPPLLFAAYEGQLDKLIHDMKRLAEHSARALRQARRGPPLGARAVERLHPWSEPRTPRERSGQRIPTFRIGARGIVGQQAHIAAATETHNFRKDYASARIARAAGDLASVFPYGTYEMRLQHGAPVAEPSLSAFVTAPGPLLSDVQAELQARAERAESVRSSAARRFELLDHARDALVDEAADLCAHAEDGMDFSQAPVRATTAAATTAPAATARDGREDGARPTVVRQHVARPGHATGHSGVRRIVTLRDRRRGRPPGHGRHGADPPV